MFPSRSPRILCLSSCDTFPPNWFDKLAATLTAAVPAERGRMALANSEITVEIWTSNDPFILRTYDPVFDVLDVLGSVGGGLMIGHIFTRDNFRSGLRVLKTHAGFCRFNLH